MVWHGMVYESRWNKVREAKGGEGHRTKGEGERNASKVLVKNIITTTTFPKSVSC